MSVLVCQGLRMMQTLGYCQAALLCTLGHYKCARGRKQQGEGARAQNKEAKGAVQALSATCWSDDPKSGHSTCPGTSGPPRGDEMCPIDPMKLKAKNHVETLCEII